MSCHSFLLLLILARIVELMCEHQSPCLKYAYMYTFYLSPTVYVKLLFYVVVIVVVVVVVLTYSGLLFSSAPVFSPSCQLYHTRGHNPQVNRLVPRGSV